MIDVNLSLYLPSRMRLARLRKIVAFFALPRLRELVKIRNREQGDYFAFSVVEVTHREDGPPELWLFPTSKVNARSVASFFEDSELDEYVTGYEQEGWALASLVNRTWDSEASVWGLLGDAESEDA